MSRRPPGGKILCVESPILPSENELRTGETVAFHVVDTPAPLRIAVLAHLHYPICPPYAGGMESHTAHLVKDLSDRGHHVTLFAKEGSNPFGPGSEGKAVGVLAETFTVQGYPDEDRRNHQHHVLDSSMQDAVRKARDGNFDVVINNSLSPVPHVHLRNIPTLHILHTPPLPRITAVISKRSSTSQMHRFATVSESNSRAWKQWLPELHVIPNGIDLDAWCGEPGNRINPGTAAWTGRITPEKGLHVAIAAARDAGMKLAIAGPVQDKEYFNSLIAPNLDQDIEYLGHLGQEELKTLISSREVFISSPLWAEPFGLTTLEAMASSTPVAALPSGAMGEIIGTSGGALADGSDSAALAAAVLRAAKMDREAVRQRAMLFTRERMLDGYEALIDQIVPRVRSARQNR